VNRCLRRRQSGDPAESLHQDAVGRDELQRVPRQEEIRSKMTFNTLDMASSSSADAEHFKESEVSKIFNAMPQ